MSIIYIACITHSRLEYIYKDASEVCLGVCNVISGAQRFDSEVPDSAQPAGSNISSISKALLTCISLMLDVLFLLVSTEEPVQKL